MPYPTDFVALSSSARALAADAGARASCSLTARQRLARGADERAANDAKFLEKVSLYREEPTWFAQAVQASLPLPQRAALASLGTSPAAMAWRRGDMAYEAGQWPEATWYWHAGCVFSNDDAAEEDALLAQTTSDSLTANQRAMALFHLTERDAVASQDLFLNARAGRRLDVVLAVDPACLPARLIQAAHMLARGDEDDATTHLGAALEHPLVRRHLPALDPTESLAGGNAGYAGYAALFEQLVRFWPQQSLLHYVHAVGCTAVKDYLAAGEAMRRATARSPRSAVLAEGMAQLAEFAGDDQQAEQHWARAIVLDARRPVSYLHVGLYQAQRGAEREAAANFARYLELEGNDAQALVELGLALGGKALWRQACGYYQQALERADIGSEARINAVLNLGVTWRKLGEYEASYARLKEAETLLSEVRRVPLFLQLGQTCAALGRADEAATWFLRAIDDRDEDDIQVVIEVAEELTDLAFYEQARTLWKIVLTSSEDDAHALVGTAITYFNEGEYGQALGYVERVLALHPTQPRARLLRGEIHVQVGDCSAALADLTVAAQATPQAEKRVWHLLCALYLRADQYEEALEQALAGLAQWPDDKTLLLFMGQSLLVVREGADDAWAQAQAIVERWTQVDPNSSLAWHTLALGRHRQQDAHGACEAMAAAYALCTDFSLLLKDYGAALLDVGNHALAAEILRAALRADPADAHTQTNLRLAMRGTVLDALSEHE